MSLVLAQIASGWPFAASLAMAVAARSLEAGRRRSALNEAVHELRRPLQALVLAAPRVRPVEDGAIEGSVRMAAVALERLDREINGDEVGMVREVVRVESLLAAATRRWRERAALGGGSIELRLGAGELAIAGDRGALAQALDNLVVNAIEHGGPAIVVEARRPGGALRISVADSGRTARPETRRKGAGELIARLSGRRRHGHGLRVVRRIAAEHGGEFQLHRSEGRTEAVLQLPLVAGRGGIGI